MNTKSHEEIKKIEADLQAKGVKYCMGVYVDIHGIPKGKVVPLPHIEHMAHGSELYTGYALDGLGQAPNDDEIASVPDLDHIIQLPWQPEIAWMPADNTFRGEPYPLNTRVALKHVLKQAESLGVGMNLGIEAELYVLKKNEDGSLAVPNPDDKLKKSCYDIRSLLDQFSWVDKMVTSINDLGWDLYSFDHEDANGQYEFDFMYADAVTTCDRFTFLRTMAKEYAKQEGLLATFMPKPFSNKTGNGAHFNMSLYDLKTNENLFKCHPKDDPKGLGITPMGYHFIGGIIKHGRALCAVFAPTVNSYKRLVRQGDMPYFTWAPVFNSFGSNNRTNSIRVPMGGGRCEARNAGGAVNPYLAATLALAAGLEGIREGLDPGQAQEDNLYNLSDAEREQRGIEFLPRTLDEAIDAFEEDDFIISTLGQELRDEFIKYKRQEWNDYHTAVSAWEVEKYSHLF